MARLELCSNVVQRRGAASDQANKALWRPRRNLFPTTKSRDKSIPRQRGRDNTTGSSRGSCSGRNKSKDSTSRIQIPFAHIPSISPFIVTANTNPGRTCRFYCILGWPPIDSAGSAIINLHLHVAGRTTKPRDLFCRDCESHLISVAAFLTNQS